MAEEMDGERESKGKTRGVHRNVASSYQEPVEYAGYVPAETCVHVP